MQFKLKHLTLALTFTILVSTDTLASTSFLTKENKLNMSGENYWTPERLKNAKPMPLPTVDMNNLKEKISELNQLVLSGKGLEAFEKFYHPDVVMQENESEPTVGKEANRKREQEFFGSITEFRGAQPLRVAAGDNVTMVEWFFDYSHKEWGRKTYHQVAVQRWKDGKIIHERFYYGS